MKKWLDKYEDGGYLGTTNKGFDYSPAWGGRWQHGGSLPGSTGMMYARTGAPSNGPYAKKTLPSAQKGEQINLGPIPYQETYMGRPTNLQLPNPTKKQLEEWDKESKKSPAQKASEKASRKAPESVGATPEQRSALAEAWVRNAYPMTALGYKMRGQDIPANFEKGEINPYDEALTAINPFRWLHDFSNAGEDLQQGNYTQAALDVASILPFVSEAKGVGSGLRLLGQDARAAGNYLTTQTPLKNAYKLNPWAFKANENNWYRQVGKEAIDDALKTRVIREAGEEVSPRMLQEFEEQLLRMQGSGPEAMLSGRRPASPFFEKGELFYPMGRKPIVTKSGKISKNPAGKGSADYLIETSLPNESFQPAYIKGMSLGVPTEVGQTAILKPNPALRDLENFKLYKQDWLRGYKPIETPTDELIDLYRIQEKGARPMSELAAEGKLGLMFQNEKAIQHFKDGEKYFGQWFTKNKADLDWYKQDREFIDPETITLRVPKSKLAQYQNYDKSLSRAADREFVIPINEQSLYKPIETPSIGKEFKSEIDWGKWNPDTPKYPELINEYNTIEESTKKAGTWMKNPDGSSFQGTPEQFVQQQSSYFKKAFGDSKLLNPDGSPAFQYHGGRKNINQFLTPQDEGYMKTDSYTGDQGIYFTPSKSRAKGYSNNTPKNNRQVYQTYINMETPYTGKIKGKYGKDDITNEQYQELLKNGYNGIIDKNLFPYHRQTIVFDPKNIKSAVGNVGFFDMTNPNIYKSLVPAVGLLGAGTATQQKKQGGVIKDNNGYWSPENWGKVVEIDSNDITMRGVNQPLLGISDTGDTKLMKPGKNYKFKGKKVKEYPVAKNGKSVQDKGQLQKLDDLTNFTNYNKPNSWLDKYK